MTEYTAAQAKADFNTAFSTISNAVLEQYMFSGESNRFVEFSKYIAVIRTEFVKYLDELESSSSVPSDIFVFSVKQPADTQLFDEFHASIQNIQFKLNESADPIEVKLSVLAGLRPNVAENWKQDIVNAISANVYRMTFPLTFKRKRYYGVKEEDYESFIGQFGLYMRGHTMYLSEKTVSTDGEYSATKAHLNELREKSAVWFLDVLIKHLVTRQHVEMHCFDGFPVGCYESMFQRLRDIGVEYYLDGNSGVFYWKN